MSEKEQLDFCGTLCGAARRLGMGLKESTKGSEFMFIWFDRGMTFAGHGRATRKEALVSACEVLQEYFAIPKQA